MTAEQNGPGGLITYSYDPVGNRLTQHDSSALTTYTYDAANQLVESGLPNHPVSYTYDQAGNLTQQNNRVSGQVYTYTWDIENRLHYWIDSCAATRSNTSEASGSAIPLVRSLVLPSCRLDISNDNKY